MTITNASHSVGAMEKLTDPVTSGSSSESELEEGEIADLDVEIITEIIRKPPDRRTNSSSLKRTVHIIPQKKDVKEVRRDVKGAGKGSQISSKRPTPRSPVMRCPPEPKLKNRKGSRQSSSSPRNWPVKRPPESRKEQIPIQAKPSSVTAKSRWVSNFVPVSGPVKMDISSDEEEEEIELRLAALQSVVNSKPKEPLGDHTDLTGVVTEETPSAAATEHVQEEEDDEELLRAQLLIEVARKQTKELTETTSSAPAAVEKAPEAVAKPVKVQIPSKVDRIIIDLREDSSDEEDDDGVEDSITALLKSARQTVEKNAEMPRAMSVLPPNKQEEYLRLKEEIARRQNRLMQGTSSKTATLTQSQTDNLSKDPPVAVNCVPNSPDTSKKVEDAKSTHQVTVDNLAPDTEHRTTGNGTVVSDVPSLQDNNSKENQEEVKSTLQAPVPVTPPTDGRKIAHSPKKSLDAVKQSPIKQQLSVKKRQLAVTAEMLKKQLSLVDKNRSLWVKSTQEVTRIKAMLQSAEETEKLLLTQLTSSQQHTQRLKKKMQTFEQQIAALEKGLSVNRVRRVSASLAAKQHPNKTHLNGPSSSHFTSFSPALRVKPKVFARALATSHLNHNKRPAGLGAAAVDLNAVKSHQASSVKKSVHDEQWLYGTLGDDWDSIAAVDKFPTWLPVRYASKSSADQFRLDPSRVICRYQLDARCCRDAESCPFQHLPIDQLSCSATPSSSQGVSSM